jgi:hypothetical protein
MKKAKRSKLEQIASIAKPVASILKVLFDLFMFLHSGK